ncbi:fumarylacetoacetate hydrolase family protein [Bacteriovorax sp. Seq25_V]|uniref:fumarylacetoacetate hydrolase family protein n=1 Tax=Bacteriovorax sp. Seq25_V TaxID=1201288 RepID=UPI00038A4231|nr:fumarylacetoacetate hydrolase family protein [Bacteriovorax sp. Seq25_V]EQC45505.1 FAH family protein [Bacteriovorax sp. Seq25_V]
MTQNIYCIGRNYRAHAEELGNEVPKSPVVFLATVSSLRSFEPAPIAFEDETFNFEAELVLKIARDHFLGEKMGKDSIEAIACGLDLTRREEQAKLKNKGLPWTTSKSFLGSTIVGEFFEVSKFHNLNSIKFDFYVNGKLRQSGDTSNMIFSFAAIINYLNTFSPLKKGDFIFTGTPSGVGEIIKNDKFEFHFLENNEVCKGQL